MYAANPRSLMIKNPWIFSLVRMLARIAMLNVIHHTCQSPEGL